MPIRQCSCVTTRGWQPPHGTSRPATSRDWPCLGVTDLKRASAQRLIGSHLALLWPSGLERNLRWVLKAGRRQTTVLAPPSIRLSRSVSCLVANHAKLGIGIRGARFERTRNECYEVNARGLGLLWGFPDPQVMFASRGFHPTEVKTPPNAVIPVVELMELRAEWPAFSRAWLPARNLWRYWIGTDRRV
jgi:hypothetical protein